MTKKDDEDTPLGIEVNECGFHVSRILGCLSSSKHSQSEKAAADLVALAKEHVKIKKELHNRDVENVWLTRLLSRWNSGVGHLLRTKQAGLCDLRLETEAVLKGQPTPPAALPLRKTKMLADCTYDEVVADLKRRDGIRGTLESIAPPAASRPQVQKAANGVEVENMDDDDEPLDQSIVDTLGELYRRRHPEPETAAPQPKFRVDVTPMADDEIDEHIKQIMVGNTEHTHEDYIRDHPDKAAPQPDLHVLQPGDHGYRYCPYRDWYVALLEMLRPFVPLMKADKADKAESLCTTCGNAPRGLQCLFKESEMVGDDTIKCAGYASKTAALNTAGTKAPASSLKAAADFVVDAIAGTMARHPELKGEAGDNYTVPEIEALQRNDPCEGCINKDGHRCNVTGTYRFDKRSIPKLPCDKFMKAAAGDEICQKCNGNGNVWKPDNNGGCPEYTLLKCDACGGSGRKPKVTVHHGEFKAKEE